jgi:hypothetical protein
VFCQLQPHQRVTALLNRATISSLAAVEAAMQQPFITDTHVEVCARCGLSPGDLKGLKFSPQLRGCCYCTVCVCINCIANFEAPEAAGGAMTGAKAVAAAAASAPWPGGLCMWCQDHADAQACTSSCSSSSSSRGLFAWQQGLASAADVSAAAAASVPLTLQQQQQLLTAQWAAQHCWRCWLGQLFVTAGAPTQ